MRSKIGRDPVKMELCLDQLSGNVVKLKGQTYNQSMQSYRTQTIFSACFVAVALLL